MWQPLGPDRQRQLTTSRQLTTRPQQAPTHEWPVVFVEEHRSLLVIREWPNGELTAYFLTRR